MLTPAFHFSILEKLAPRLQGHAEKFAQDLENLVLKDPDGAVDLMPQVTKTTLAAIMEVAMGVTLKDAGDKYVKAIHSISSELCYRLLHPWVWSNIFYFWILPRGRKHYEDVAFVHAYSNKVISERKAVLQLKKSDSSEQSSTHADEDEIGIRRKLTFLDLMLTAQENGAELSDEDIRNEVDTFMFEGHDTTAMGIYWTLYLLADHPEIQERLREEVCATELKDASKLPFLDKVAREASRLYPSVPFISRQVDYPLSLGNGHTLSSPNIVNVHFYDLHRDPKYFPDPLKFDPDREYPSHPFAYVPFSGGSRNCIGRRLALTELKLVVAATLRRLRLNKPPLRHDEVPVPIDLVLRPGISVKIPLEPLKQ